MECVKGTTDYTDEIVRYRLSAWIVCYNLSDLW